MDIMFLITGFIFALIVPILNLNVLGVKGFIYSFLMIVFIIFVFAYTILSFFKFKISKIDYLKSKAIISWDNGIFECKQTNLPYIISLAFGLLLGVFVYLKNIGLVNAILVSLACAFVILGWLLMGNKRLENKKKSTDSFLLAHMGIIYEGRVEIFNGYSKGITNAKIEGNNLILTLLKNKKETELKFSIPDTKKEEVSSFLNDLTEFFSGDNNG